MTIPRAYMLTAVAYAVPPSICIWCYDNFVYGALTGDRMNDGVVVGRSGIERDVAAW